MGRAGRAVKAFWVKAYEDGITGLAAMVAYNLLLSIFPLVFLALFVGGQVLESEELERSVLTDLRQLFPSAADETLTNAVDRVRDTSASLGILALIAALWIGASFWGALDTAFCRIYHCQCRSWVRQKLFALSMLVVVLLFVAATVAVPTLQSVLVSGREDLPLGLDDVHAVVFGLTLLAGLLVLFIALCAIYWRVPKTRVPWRAIWPGALVATVAMGVVDYVFPFYLTSVSTIGSLGPTLVFILIALLWFYALALILLAGAVINDLRFLHGAPPR